MRWNDHSRISGLHAFLGASKYHWINYNEEKIKAAYESFQAVALGTRYHELAAEMIRLKVKPEKRKKTFNLYVNDAIGFDMSPEVVLMYSENCFGTTDAICFRDGMLRIHDLKTGMTPAHIEQLYIYEALFCLEYDVRPQDIESELRLYQFNEIKSEGPDPKDIQGIMDKIKLFDKIITEMKANE
jgi:hypothetical protein